MPAGNETYDVFVSYSRADGRHAEEIASFLRAKDLKPFFDRRNLAPALPWLRGAGTGHWRGEGGDRVDRTAWAQQYEHDLSEGAGSPKKRDFLPSLD